MRTPPPTRPSRRPGRRSRWAVALTVALLALVAPSGAAAYGWVAEWGGPGGGPGQFTDLRDVATDTNGNVFTAEAGRLQKFGTDRAFVTQVAAGPGQSFSSIAVHGVGATGIVYAVDRDHGVRRYRASDLAPLGPLTLPAPPVNWGRPRAITLDHLGNVIVAYPNDDDPVSRISGIAIYSPAGAFIRTIGEYAAGDAGADAFRYTTPVDIDDDGQPGGKVWVTDATKRRLFSFRRSDGSNATGSSTTPPTAWAPGAVAVMPLDPVFPVQAIPLDYTVYVADTGPGDPADLTVDRMYVWESGGPFQGRFGARGSGEQRYGRIAGIEIDGSQRMFLADATQQKVLEYGNGGSPGPGDPQDPVPPPAPPPTPSGPSGPSPQPTDPAAIQPQVCIGLWSVATCGWLPKPPTLQVCVSYWENCNGFQGLKPASPGTIDMSGFPSAINVDMSCAEINRAVTRQAPSYVKPETQCLVEGYLEGSLPKQQLTRKRLELLWNMDARAFKAEVAAAYAVTISGLRAASAPLMGENGADPLGVKVFFFISDLVDKLYDDVARIGQPFAPPAIAISPARVCDTILGDDLRRCQLLVASLNGAINGNLGLLAQRKRDLFLDISFNEYFTLLEKRKGEVLKNLESGAKERAGTARATKRPSTAKRNVARKRTVFASGQVTIAQGKRGRLKLRTTKAMRDQMKRLRRAGVRTFKATMVTRASLVPGRTVVRRKTVTISLVKVRRTPAKRQRPTAA